ncbi:AAA family ATPase [Acidithiobacillus thiooxidans]|uniref:AAA+ ATPase domain-containing protein n=1 Tax=Acidithiobacillus thiooxidans ATCC 19377 TaxID=637390 RepID=A0A5P9XN36_ACITH|nr:AAA family ATPase [Acidithiobacillus thiooxidans]QFX95208.1 hypothetical protein GCD22_00742 [Acidithiobacillus thiooxidans ATCC 19377]
MSDLRDFPILRGLTEPDDLPPLDAYDELVEQPTPRLSVVPAAGPSAGADELPEPQPARPPLLRHVRDLLTNPPAVRWLIRGIVEADTLAMLYGQPGAGKSFIALSMAASIACGSDWHGHRVAQGPSVYILGEGGGGVSRRLRAWQLSNPDARLQDAPLYVSSRMVPMGEAEAVEEIAAAIADAGTGKPSSVWIDTLARAAAGLDENSSRDMGELIKACDAIRERYGCAVILVHHAGHNQDRARGSSAIKAALDTELSATKDGQVITLASTKSKESEGFKPLTFQLAGVDTGWNDEDGERVYSAVLEPCDAPGQDEAIGKNQTLCLGVLREMYANRRANLEQAGNDPESAKVTTTEWREGAGLNKQRFYDAKTSLIKLGLVEIQGSTVKVTGNGPVTVGNKRYPGSLVTSGPGGSIDPAVTLPPRYRKQDAVGNDEGENYEDF